MREVDYSLPKKKGKKKKKGFVVHGFVYVVT